MMEDSPARTQRLHSSSCLHTFALALNQPLHCGRTLMRNVPSIGINKLHWQQPKCLCTGTLASSPGEEIIVTHATPMPSFPSIKTRGETQDVEICAGPHTTPKTYYYQTGALEAPSSCRTAGTCTCNNLSSSQGNPSSPPALPAALAHSRLPSLEARAGAGGQTSLHHARPARIPRLG